MISIFSITMLLCLALSFFFSGMEAGVFALSRLRVRRLMRQGNRNARALHEFLSSPENFLWTIFVGNTATNFVTAALAVFAARQWLSQNPALFAVLFFLGVLVFYAAFELLPKMIFRLYPNRLCMMLARPFRVIHLLMRPLVAVVRWLAGGLMRWSGGRTFTGNLFVNRDELRRVMHESARDLSSEERSMIERVLDLQSLRIGHVMVPIARATGVTTTTPVAEALAVCRERGLSRLPVWQEQAGARRVIGLFNLRSELYSNGKIDTTKTVGEYLQPATFLDVDMQLDDAMRHLQRTGQRLAIALSRDRREVGIISLQDILKALFGKVRL